MKPELKNLKVDDKLYDYYITDSGKIHVHKFTIKKITKRDVFWNCYNSERCNDSCERCLLYGVFCERLDEWKNSGLFHDGKTYDLYKDELEAYRFFRSLEEAKLNEMKTKLIFEIQKL